jgi:hypothetical protein
MSGVVDIVAKTSEGLDNQTRSRIYALIASSRLRKPRPFYEHNFIIRPYNYFHANWAHKMAID